MRRRPSPRSEERRLMGNFGAVLLQYKKQRKMSYATLAKKSGLSPNYLWRVVRGQENVTLRTIIRVAKAFNVDTVTFFTYVNDYREGDSLTSKKGE